MMQGKIREDRDGNEIEKAINSRSEKPFFQNQIVPVWASTKDAAAILGISANALRIRKCRGEIDCRYFGKYLRFDVGQLQSLFREQRVSRKEN
jgi:hypothetical protein